MSHKFTRFLLVLLGVFALVMLTSDYSSRLQASLEGYYFSTSAGLRFTAYLLMPYFLWPAIFIGEVLAKTIVYAREASQWGNGFRDAFLELLPMLITCFVIHKFRARHHSISDISPSVLGYILLAAAISSLGVLLCYGLVLAFNNPPSVFDLFYLVWQLMLDDLSSVITILPIGILLYFALRKSIGKIEYRFIAVALAGYFIVTLISPLLDPTLQNIKLLLYLGSLLISFRYGLVCACIAIVCANAITLHVYGQNATIEHNAEVQIFLLVLTISGLVVGSISDQHAKDREKIKHSNQQLRSYAARLTSAQEDERRRISSELHDDIGQNLTAIGLELSLIDKGQSNSANASTIGSLKSIVAATYESVYRMLHQLHPIEIELFGLIESLQTGKLHTLLSASNLAYVFSSTGEIRTIPDPCSTALYRIAQEAATNTIKYANAHTFTIHIRFEQDAVCMHIQDDGKGFDASPDATLSVGFGLANMTARCEALGGTLNIHSNTNGTAIEARIPC